MYQGIVINLQAHITASIEVNATLDEQQHLIYYTVSLFALQNVANMQQQCVKKN